MDMGVGQLCTGFMVRVASPTMQMLGALRSQWSIPLARGCNDAAARSRRNPDGTVLGKPQAALRGLSMSTYRLRLAPGQKACGHGRAHETLCRAARLQQSGRGPTSRPHPDAIGSGVAQRCARLQRRCTTQGTAVAAPIEIVSVSRTIV